MHVGLQGGRSGSALGAAVRLRTRPMPIACSNGLPTTQPWRRSCARLPSAWWSTSRQTMPFPTKRIRYEMPTASSEPVCLISKRSRRTTQVTSSLGQQTPQLHHDPASDLTYRLRPGTGPSNPAFLLLHGFGGDEDVLWVIEFGPARRGARRCATGAVCGGRRGIRLG